MTTTIDARTDAVTIGDLLRRLGDISPDRVRASPAPGTATVADVDLVRNRERRLCELVDGTPVEKPVGHEESMLAALIIELLSHFVWPRNLGVVTGEGGMMELFSGLVRIPDVAFVSWSRIPGGKRSRDPVPELVPDLAVEVLSRSNTTAEMARKRSEYFQAGVRLVWEIDPEPRTAAVYLQPENPLILTAEDVIDGGEVLPGFALPLRELLGELDRCAGSPAHPQ